jgi:uncharacterized OsmC-like protein
MATSTIGEKIHETVALIRKNPSAARAMFKAQTRLGEGTQVSAFVRKFPALIIDEPANLGGNDSGMNPVELLLVSLGACQEIVYALYASMIGIKLDSVCVDLKGYLDARGFTGMNESVPAGYQKITYETRIESRADAESIRALIRTVEARCPTLDTLKRPVEVQGRVLLNGEPFATR